MEDPSRTVSLVLCRFHTESVGLCLNCIILILLVKYKNNCGMMIKIKK